MKKNLFLWLMLIMLGFGGMAQTEVTIGNGSYSYNTYAPMNLWYKYAITQSIYLADEIGMSGYINSIAYKQTVTGATRNITVYMAETDKSQFSSSSDALSASEFTEVFSGSWTIGVGEWSEIELTTPFEYTGTGNLVIAIVDGTGSDVGMSKYWQSSTGTGRILYQCNDNNPYTISSTGFNTPANYYPDVKLTISEGENTCHPVTNLANSGVTANSATISWTAPEDGGSYIVMCKKSNQSWEDDDVVTIDGISETEYEITGLSAATAYDVRVINDCGDNQSAARSTNFTTLCAPIADLPYVQNFDAVATDSMPACWAKLNPYTNYPRVTTNKAMSGKAMEFHANGASYAVLPEFEEDLSNLQISFYTRREGANSGSFDAGYIFNMDTATFVPVYSTTSGEIGDNDYHKIIAKFTEFESDGESVANIAFRYKNAPSFSSWYWFVDEVKVDYATDCTEPTQLSVSNIKSTSADLSWVSDADDYTVYYKKTSDTEYDMYENVTLDDNNVYTLEGLDPETKYTWYVEANCSSAVPSDTATFTTECSPHSELPYTWDFESGNTGGTTAYPLPSCWKRNEANNTNYPYVYETTSTSPNVTSGIHYLYFYSTGNTAIMNAIDIESFDITSLQISFNGRSAATAGSPIIVGIMTDPFNASTFDTVSVVALTNTMDSYDVIFANYEGEGTYIALRNGSSSSTYLDDVVLDYISDCPKVQNLAVSNITGEGATVTWTGSVDSYVVRYRAASDSVWNTDGAEIDGTTATLSGLNPTTSYVVQVAPDCGDEIAETMYKGVTFKTICSVYELPYETSFENSDEDECWTVASEGEIWEYDYDYGYYLNTYPDFNHYATSSARTGTGMLEIASEEGYNLVMAAPKLNANIEDLRLQFYARYVYSSSYFENGIFQVGVMSNPADTSTFVLVQNIELTGTSYEMVTVDFNNAGVTGSDYHVAFRLIGAGEDGYSNLIYIDDITIKNIPACLEPTGVAASNITTTTADITWTSEEESFNLYYKKASDSEYEVVEGVSLTDGVYTLESLDPSLSYSLYVATVCPDGTESAAQPIMFSTACDVISALPYSMNFDAVTTNEIPNCWDTISPYNNYPRVTTSNPRSGKALEFRANGASYAVLPEFEEDLSGLQLTFYTRREGDNSGAIEAGYIFNLDTATFVSLYSISSEEIGNNNYVKAIVSLADFESDGESTARIAFRYKNKPTYNNWYWFVDDVEVGYIPACAEPSQLSAGNIMATSANLTWVSNAVDYNIYYRKTADTSYVSVTNVTLDDEAGYLLEELEPNTSYTWYVEANCEDGSSVQSDPATFTTECAAITELPQSWGFESPNTGGTTSYPLPACWSRLGSPYYPYCYGYYAHSGSNCLYFGGVQNVIAVMPAIDPVEITTSNAQVSFYAQGNNNTLEVGYLTDPADASTFSVISSITLTSSHTLYTVALPEYNEEGYFYVGFRTPYSQYVYVDDVTLEERPYCAAATNLTASNVTSSSADLSWVSNIENVNVYYKASNATEYESFEDATLTDGVFTIENLEPATQYSWYVETVCDDSTYKSATVTFNTECVAIASVPQSWGFEAPNAGGTSTYPLPVCWSRAGSNSYPYVYIYATPNTGSRALYFYDVNNTAVLPRIDVDQLNINELQLSFYARTSYSSGDMIVGVMTDPTDLSTFDTVATVSTTSSYQLFEVPFDTYTGEGSYIAIRSGSSSTKYVDDVKLENIPACSKVLNLTVSDITVSSATVSWTGSNEDGYNVKYRVAGSETWNEETASTESIDLTGLNASTTYEVAVSPVCEEEVEAVTTTFSTACDVVSEFPFTESFENGLGCWTTNIISGSANWTVESTSYQSTTTPDGSKYALFKTSSHGPVAELISPVFDLTSLSNAYLSFYHIQKLWISDQDELYIYYKTSPTAEKTLLTSFTSNISTWQLDSIALPNPSEEYQIIFEGHSEYGYGIGLDKIMIYDGSGDAPVVVEPTVATNNAQDMTQTSATLYGEITNAGNQAITARGFEWKAVAGGTVATVNAAGTTTFSANLTGLTAATEYTFRAFATTANGNSYGEWKNFTTLNEDQEPCNAPTNVTVTDFGKNSITITWDANGAEKWAAQYRKQGSTAWTMGSNNITSPTYTFSGLEEATVYEYQVQAICDGTTSAWSQTGSHSTGIDSRLMNSVSLYPNPATNHVDVLVSDNDVTVSRLEVYDVYGKLLNEVEVVDNPTRIDVSSLASGVYFVKVITGEGVATKTFVKK